MKNLAVLTILALSSCGDDRAGDGDGDDTIMLMDSGTPPPNDSGTPPPPTDSGGGEMCPPLTFPAPAAACSMAQLQEFQAAIGMSMTDGGAALMAWSNMPANMGCSICLNGLILSVASMNGCDDELGNAECCLDMACPNPMDQACVQAATDEGGACGAEEETLLNCVSTSVMNLNLAMCQM